MELELQRVALKPLNSSSALSRSIVVSHSSSSLISIPLIRVCLLIFPFGSQRYRSLRRRIRWMFYLTMSTPSPPNREMIIFHGKIHLTIPDTSLGDRMKIYIFFKSLAEEHGARAIGVIFSGTGTDGTLGLQSVQGSGGISVVKDPIPSKYDECREMQ